MLQEGAQKLLDRPGPENTSEDSRESERGQEFDNIATVSNMLNLSGSLQDGSIRRLLYSVRNDEPKDESKDPNECMYIINLTELQRLSLQAMKTRLARNASYILEEKTLSERTAILTASLMHKYCTLDHSC